MLDDVETWVNGVADGDRTVLRAAHGRLDSRVVLDLAVDHQISRSATEPLIAAELFETAVVELPPMVEREQLEAALENWPNEIVRVKGIVTLANEGTHVVQRVARRWSIEPTTRKQDTNKLVVIALRDTAVLDQLARDLIPTG